MIRQGKNCNDINKFMSMTKACLKHMFDNHIYCNSQWSLAKKSKEEGNAYTHPTCWISCSGDHGPKIYCQLNQIVEQYGSIISTPKYA